MYILSDTFCGVSGFIARGCALKSDLRHSQHGEVEIGYPVATESPRRLAKRNKNFHYISKCHTKQPCDIFLLFYIDFPENSRLV